LRPRPGDGRGATSWKRRDLDSRNVGSFLITLIVLLVYWQRSLVNIRAGIRSIHPTPSERLSAPF
jgi:hypothetical protein